MTFQQLFTNSNGLSANGTSAKTATMRGYLERSAPLKPSASEEVSLTWNGVEYASAYDLIFHENPGHTASDADSVSLYGFRVFQSGTGSSAVNKVVALSISGSYATPVAAHDDTPDDAMALDGMLLEAILFGDWSTVDSAVYQGSSASRW